MALFIVNRNQQTNGDHEVHNLTTGCAYMPQVANQIQLGNYPTCREAVAAAKITLRVQKVNGCYYCCRLCHTQ